MFLVVTASEAVSRPCQPLNLGRKVPLDSR